MSSIRSVRRATRAALAFLAAALAPSAARAQSACAAGTLADYLAPGFACRVGAWAFDGFEYLPFVNASPGVTAYVPDAQLVDVLPFRRVDAGQHVTVGFDFFGLGSSLTVTGSQRGDEEGTAVAQVQLFGHALSPAAALRSAGAELTASLDGTRQATSFLSASSFVQVTNVFGVEPSCVSASTQSPDDPGFVDDVHLGDCVGAPTLDVFTLLASIAQLDRDHDDQPATLFGITTGSVQRVTFVTAQVAPEPSTVVLAASGLLGVAAVARRRRRA